MDEILSVQVNATISELRQQRDYFADRCASLVQEIAKLQHEQKIAVGETTKHEPDQL